MCYDCNKMWYNIHANIGKYILFLLISYLFYLYSSYLYPDGRSYNPDLTGLCEPTPHDHIKVTQVGGTACGLYQEHISIDIYRYISA